MVKNRLDACKTDPRKRVVNPLRRLPVNYQECSLRWLVIKKLTSKVRIP